MSPRLSSARNASRTEVRLTTNFSASLPAPAAAGRRLLKPPFGDQLLDLPDDLLVDPRRLDRSKLDGVIVRSPAAGRAHRRPQRFSGT